MYQNCHYDRINYEPDIGTLKNMTSYMAVTTAICTVPCNMRTECTYLTNTDYTVVHSVICFLKLNITNISCFTTYCYVRPNKTCQKQTTNLWLLLESVNVSYFQWHSFLFLLQTSVVVAKLSVYCPIHPFS